MEYEIAGGGLEARVSSLGAELVSLRDQAGREYLWQGDPAFWTGHAPHLFPLVGRQTGGRYRLDQREYEMGTHGFFRRTEIPLVKKEGNSITFALGENEGTLAQYPRSFLAGVTYRLLEHRADISFSVTNRDSRPLYFGYGGHPGFFVPLEEGLIFEDYYLEFSAPCSPSLVGMTDSCYLDPAESRIPFPLEEGRKLRLSHSLFDRDALILEGTSGEVTLKSDKGKRSVTVSYPGMNYLGLWHKPGCPAPYVCIEPWASLPAREGVAEELEERRDLICLDPGGAYEARWSIRVE